MKLKKINENIFKNENIKWFDETGQLVWKKIFVKLFE